MPPFSSAEPSALVSESIFYHTAYVVEVDHIDVLDRLIWMVMTVSAFMLIYEGCCHKVGLVSLKSCLCALL